MNAIEIAWEPWRTLWPDAKAMMADHFKEVEGGLALMRPFGVVSDTMERLDDIGVMKCATARTPDRLVGYMTWMLTPDIESFGTLKADQGAVYVSPDSPKAGMLGLSYRMFRFCIPELKRMGAKFVFLHHRLRGRGRNLGLMFERFGAVEIKHEYYLWIGD